jgi:hypothetical protein
MKTKTNKSRTTAADAQLCQNVASAVSQLLERISPPEAARRHFKTARLELLKGFRALLDARIERVSNSTRKGEKIQVE